MAKDILDKNLEKVKITGKTISEEYWVNSSQGDEFCFLSKITRVDFENGAFNYLMVVSVDITLRKKEELKLLNLSYSLKSSNHNLKNINTNLKILNSFSDKIQKAITINDVVRSITKNAIFEFDNIDCEIYLIDESGEYMMQSAAFINEKLGLIKKLKPIISALSTFDFSIMKYFMFAVSLKYHNLTLIRILLGGVG